MKTDELIAMLAAGESAVDLHAMQKRYTTALGLGMIGAALLMASLLGVRHDLAEAVMLPAFWIKLGFVAALVASSLYAVLRLSRPGTNLDWVGSLMAAPVMMMWTLAAFAFFEADPVQRPTMFFGSTWRTCPLLIAMLSVPLFIGIMWAMKGLAPTRTRLAGFAGGLLAGSTAALIYCLHCPEMATPFIGFWYLLGMLIPAVLGMLLSERLLRW